MYPKRNTIWGHELDSSGSGRILYNAVLNTVMNFRVILISSFLDQLNDYQLLKNAL
jgi:hypothetical protein